MGRAIAAISTAVLPKPFIGLRTVLSAFWHEITGAAYRPERHYMRGPGPAWHAKHDQAPIL